MNKKEMIEAQIKMFGTTQEELLNMLKDARNPKMLIISILSDAQEVDGESARKHINAAKFLIDQLELVK